MAYLLLVLALAGGAVRHWTDKGTIAHDLGTLLLVLWLPIIGTVVGFVINKTRRMMKASKDFPQDAAFAPQLLVRLEGTVTASMDTLERVTLVLDKEGFSARTRIAPPQARQGPTTLELEFLRPQLALSRFPKNTCFDILVQGQVVAQGRVLGVLS